jgi:hypothetical protein
VAGTLAKKTQREKIILSPNCRKLTISNSRFRFVLIIETFFFLSILNLVFPFASVSSSRKPPARKAVVDLHRQRVRYYARDHSFDKRTWIAETSK